MPPGEPTDRLLIFVRAPRPGTVKTRLAGRLGMEGAAKAYVRLVDRLIASLAGLRQVELHFTPDDALNEIRPWLRDGWKAHPQIAGDLGTRMNAAFEGAFGAGAKKAVLIGSDCPWVTPADVESAWRGLDFADVVLGPALDGGYWLIGLRQPQPPLFEKIPWSTAIVLHETKALAAQNGLTIQLLRALPDVDTIEDWLEFIAKDQGAP